jgi:hypothetical protein
LNWDLIIAEFCELERRLESAQVPKYFFPLALMRSAKLLAELEPVGDVVDAPPGVVGVVEVGAGVVA